MTTIDTHVTIEKLLSNPNVIEINHFHDEEHPFLEIQFTTKNHTTHVTTISTEDAHFMLGGFTLSSIRDFQYIRPRHATKYTHQQILPVDSDMVVHHLNGTLDNRRESLVAMSRGEHSRLHKALKKQSTTH